MIISRSSILRQRFPCATPSRSSSRSTASSLAAARADAIQDRTHGRQRIRLLSRHLSPLCPRCVCCDLIPLPILGGDGVEMDLIGDIHCENYGTYKAYKDGLIHYDIDDFDETTQGRFDVDVCRFATNILLAAQQARRYAGQSGGRRARRHVRLPGLQRARPEEREARPRYFRRKSSDSGDCSAHQAKK